MRSKKAGVERRAVIGNRRKHSEFDNPKFDLDNDTKWMYVNEKGSTLFAVYSKHDVDDPTVLYGTHGKKAEADYARLNRYFEEGQHYAGNNRATFDRILNDIKSTKRGASDGISPVGRRGTTDGNVFLPFGESESNGRRNYVDGTENLEEHPLTEYTDEASDNPGASFVTFSNDYAAIRNFMKDGDGAKYSLSDSNGRQLSNEQQEYFKDSVVRDENGNLKVMYHGTSRGGFNVFDTYGSNYGLFGIGSYFTDNAEVGQSYTKKGKSNSPKVYETYLNIKNPLDMVSIGLQIVRN